MSTGAKRRLASAGFVALLILSVFWPSPIVAVNRLCCNAPLGIDELSFLGREAPAWDVVFWCLSGLFALWLLQDTRDFGAILAEFRATRLRIRTLTGIAIIAAAALVAQVWMFVDSPVTEWAERINSDSVEDWIRIANRFGGGMNPVMIILFFALAGLAYAKRDWVGYAIRMLVAGAAGGAIVQIVKFAIGRTRPELWLGPFHHARVSASSFPSGHTVGAFALAGVLILNAESKTLRAIAVLLALAVAVSRVLAFRHWTSDVTASAAIGLIVAATLRSPRSSR
ncbi:MAG TPA: phosphatase PAP2 family protein [Thermoanaerobaculia bacterium]|nr:phosphatase PAP2 family protein [Thermoanaerobaculia bacterium]